MEWNVSDKIVNELLEAKPEGVTTRLQALLVFQHCTVHNMSLFDFFAGWKVDGLRLVPKCDPPKSVPSPFLNELMEELGGDEQKFPAEPDPKSDYEYSDWRTFTLSADRLERLRKHIAEVQQFGMTLNSEIDYLNQLKGFESSLAAVVEPVPTLGMVSDDVEDDAADDSELVDEVEEVLEEFQPGQSAELVPALAPASAAEQSEIAAVLANPSAAHSVPEPVRKDAAGRVLVTDAKLADLYAKAEKLSMNKVQVQEIVMRKFNLRSIDDLPDALASKFIENMQSKINAA